MRTSVLPPEQPDLSKRVLCNSAQRGDVVRRARYVIALLVLAGAAYLTGSMVAEAKEGDSYYMIVFSSQNESNQPRFAHTFATFVRTSGDSGAEDAVAEIHTISWMPRSLEIVVVRRW